MSRQYGIILPIEWLTTFLLVIEDNIRTQMTYDATTAASPHRSTAMIIRTPVSSQPPGVTLRATSIAAGMIGVLLAPTLLAEVEMAAHGFGPAVEDILERATMTRKHVPAESAQVLRTVTSEDVG
jgi:hypothetical protein